MSAVVTCGHRACLVLASVLIVFCCSLRAQQRLSKRTKLVRDLITEVAGMAPYEKRIRDILVVRLEPGLPALCIAS